MDPHAIGGGSSFFGSHFGNNFHQEHRKRAQQPHHYGHQYYAQPDFSHQQSCRTVTERVGNMITTYTQCS